MYIPSAQGGEAGIPSENGPVEAGPVNVASVVVSQPEMQSKQM